MGIDQSKVDALLARARREVDEGLLPSTQVALAYQGELVAFETYGDATVDTRYPVFSATKAFVASSVWTLIGEGLVDPSKLVIEYIPEFGTNGKDVITVEQVMLHTSGFPHAPLAAASVVRPRGPRHDGSPSGGSTGSPAPATSTTRRRRTGCSARSSIASPVSDFRDELETRVTGPIGLPRVLGIEQDAQTNVATLVAVGEHATPDELEATFGIRELPVTEVTDDGAARLQRSRRASASVCPAAAASCARRPRALLPGAAAQPGRRVEARRARRRDEQRAQPAARSDDGHPGQPQRSGSILAGDDGRSHIRGMGRTVSPGTFGHNGAGGQLAWADPATGLSFGYCTNGLDANEVREPRRGTALSSLAAVCTS